MQTADGTCSTYGRDEMENAHSVLVGKLEGKTSFRRPRCT